MFTATMVDRDAIIGAIDKDSEGQQAVAYTAGEYAAVPTILDSGKWT